MENKEIIKKTYRFLKENLDKSISFNGNCERSVQYRLEHSIRVMNIGKIIAINEGYDVTKMMVTCLLHDIGYSVEMKEEKDYKEHGRIGARIARDFIASLGYSKKDCEEMCYGIAIHVDDKADFDHERTSFALSIGDADNIDRFDAFRLYEGLHLADYRSLSLDKQLEMCNKYLNRLPKLKELDFATKTAINLWNEKIDYQIGFYQKLKNQIENSILEE